MAKFFTVVALATGIQLRRKDGNPYEGELHETLRHYKGVKSYDLLSADEQDDALLLYVTDWSQLVLEAHASKLADVATACAAEDVEYSYEERDDDRIVVFMSYKEKLERRLCALDYSYDAEAFAAEAEAAAEQARAEAEAIEKLKLETAARAKAEAMAESLRTKAAADQRAIEAAEARAEAAEEAKAEAEARAEAEATAAKEARAEAEAAKQTAEEARAEAEAAHKAVDEAEAKVSGLTATLDELKAKLQAAEAKAAKAPGGAEWKLNLGDLSDFD